MFKGRQFDQSVILLCVRWYLAYNLSLRDLKEMMAERGTAGPVALSSTAARPITKPSLPAMWQINCRIVPGAG